MATWKIVSLVGLGLNLVGVIMLFKYALPKRQRTEGILFSWTVYKPNKELIALERRWDVRSGVGLWCAIVGIALQGFGIWLLP